MRKLWLLFTQAVTVALAVYFVFGIVKPETPHFAAPPSVTSMPSSVAARTEGLSFRGAVSQSLPSVVHILTTQKARTRRGHPLFNDPLFRHFFGDRAESPQPNSPGLGSGVIVASNGYILTNFHVINGADEIEVLLNDGKKLSADIVGSDPDSDLAVLRVKADNLPVMPFGNMEAVAVGDVVLAIGNPFGVGQTVTMGIVSALGRSHLGINTFENFIQTDAAINPGNSGGALVDAKGHLIGINTAIFSQSGGSLGIGFAIPVSLARNIMEQIIQNGDVVRGWIGVEVQEVTAELANSIGLPDSQGVLLAGVVRGGPADMAGIRPGEVLLAINGQKITDPKDMLDKVAALKPREPATFLLRHQAMMREVSVQVGKRPKMQRPGR